MFFLALGSLSEDLMKRVILNEQTIFEDFGLSGTSVISNPLELKSKGYSENVITAIDINILSLRNDDLYQFSG
jgi:hypothetical protein